MAQNNQEQKKLLTEIMELDAKDGLYERETAVEWLFSQIPFEWTSSREAYDAFKIAKQMEEDIIYQTQAFWYGRGIAASKEDKIKEYAPKKENV